MPGGEHLPQPVAFNSPSKQDILHFGELPETQEIPVSFADGGPESVQATDSFEMTSSTNTEEPRLSVADVDGADLVSKMALEDAGSTSISVLAPGDEAIISNEVLHVSSLSVPPLLESRNAGDVFSKPSESTAAVEGANDVLPGSAVESASVSAEMDVVNVGTEPVASSQSIASSAVNDEVQHTAEIAMRLNPSVDDLQVRQEEIVSCAPVRSSPASLELSESDPAISTPQTHPVIEPLEEEIPKTEDSLISEGEAQDAELASRVQFRREAELSNEDGQFTSKSDSMDIAPPVDIVAASAEKDLHVETSPLQLKADAEFCFPLEVVDNLKRQEFNPFELKDKDLEYKRAQRDKARKKQEKSIDDKKTDEKDKKDKEELEKKRKVDKKDTRRKVSSEESSDTDSSSNSDSDSSDDSSSDSSEEDVKSKKKSGKSAIHRQPMEKPLSREERKMLEIERLFKVQEAREKAKQQKRNEKVARSQGRPSGSQKSEKESSKLDKTVKLEKSVKLEKADKNEKSEKHEKPEKLEKSEKEKVTTPRAKAKEQKPIKSGSVETKRVTDGDSVEKKRAKEKEKSKSVSKVNEKVDVAAKVAAKKADGSSTPVGKKPVQESKPADSVKEKEREGTASSKQESSVSQTSVKAKVKEQRDQAAKDSSRKEKPSTPSIKQHPSHAPDAVAKKATGKDADASLHAKEEIRREPSMKKEEKTVKIEAAREKRSKDTAKEKLIEKTGEPVTAKKKLSKESKVVDKEDEMEVDEVKRRVLTKRKRRIEEDGDDDKLKHVTASEEPLLSARIRKRPVAVDAADSSNSKQQRTSATSAPDEKKLSKEVEREKINKPNSVPVPPSPKVAAKRKAQEEETEPTKQKPKKPKTEQLPAASPRSTSQLTVAAPSLPVSSPTIKTEDATQNVSSEPSTPWKGKKKWLQEFKDSVVLATSSSLPTSDVPPSSGPNSVSTTVGASVTESQTQPSASPPPVKAVSLKKRIVDSYVNANSNSEDINAMRIPKLPEDKRKALLHGIPLNKADISSPREGGSASPTADVAAAAPSPSSSPVPPTAASATAAVTSAAASPGLSDLLASPLLGLGLPQLGAMGLQLPMGSLMGLNLAMNLANVTGTGSGVSGATTSSTTPSSTAPSIPSSSAPASNALGGVAGQPPAAGDTVALLQQLQAIQQMQAQFILQHQQLLFQQQLNQNNPNAAAINPLLVAAANPFLLQNSQALLTRLTSGQGQDSKETPNVSDMLSLAGVPMNMNLGVLPVDLIRASSTPVSQQLPSSSPSSAPSPSIPTSQQSPHPYSSSSRAAASQSSQSQSPPRESEPTFQGRPSNFSSRPPPSRESEDEYSRRLPYPPGGKGVHPPMSQAPFRSLAARPMGPGSGHGPYSGAYPSNATSSPDNRSHSQRNLSPRSRGKPVNGHPQNNFGGYRR
eukprot:GILJ01005094.1.p1 GENE.GILJ01005094.1~~GILJ01005094.1.p1  ORF type:complete len:1421 (+),score=284.81 GILJ01005094.1:184-4446(+)